MDPSITLTCSALMLRVLSSPPPAGSSYYIDFVSLFLTLGRSLRGKLEGQTAEVHMFPKDSD
jgi:hypothetical protein